MICRLFICAVVILALPVSAQDRQIRFSAADVSVLKDIQNIQSLADAAAKLILAAPVLQLLASPNPVDVVVTLTGTDWEGIGKAPSALQKIAACEIFKIVTLHTTPGATDQMPKGEALEYFMRIRQASEEGCDG